VRGHAAAAAFVHRFSAANAHVLAAFGLTPAYMRDRQRGFSTFEFRLRFRGALGAGELVRVRSGLVHIGSSSMRIAHRMTRARTGDEVATLEQSGVLLDVAARRPTPIPDDLRARAKTLLVGETAAGSGRP
jgi:acyl-CoA thioester hydrolase